MSTVCPLHQKIGSMSTRALFSPLLNHWGRNSAWHRVGVVGRMQHLLQEASPPLSSGISPTSRSCYLSLIARCTAASVVICMILWLTSVSTVSRNQEEGRCYSGFSYQQLTWSLVQSSPAISKNTFKWIAMGPLSRKMWSYHHTQCMLGLQVRNSWSQSFQATLTKYHRLSDLRQQEGIAHSSRSWKSNQGTCMARWGGRRLHT